jgi:hypothetical protein
MRVCVFPIVHAISILRKRVWPTSSFNGLSKCQYNCLVKIFLTILGIKIKDQVCLDNLLFPSLFSSYLIFALSLLCHPLNILIFISLCLGQNPNRVIFYFILFRSWPKWSGFYFTLFWPQPKQSGFLYIHHN